ncbi:hypothetical protein MASR1M12_34750 [Erysipelotrichia bacterium]
MAITNADWLRSDHLQPYIVAYMTERVLQLAKGERVLEIGTGSGYQAAVLAELGADVYSMVKSFLSSLARHRRSQGDGLRLPRKMRRWLSGWPTRALFGNHSNLRPSELPENLVEQLAEGGRMICRLATLIHRDL